MKYSDIILKEVLSNEWKSTSRIKSETEKKVNKNINWCSIYALLLEFLNESKVERIESGKITLWKKK